MSSSRISLQSIALIPLIALVGCQRGTISESPEGPTTEQLVRFYSPAGIKILPFTKPRSFDDDLIPDGIAVSLRPLDQAGDPVKAYGTFIFDLHAYKPGLASHKGELIQNWTQPVPGMEEQKKFWERVTATYEFQLSWEGRPLPPQKRYVLVASFQGAGGDRLFDEYEFEFRLDRQDVLSSVEGDKGQ